MRDGGDDSGETVLHRDVGHTQRQTVTSIRPFQKSFRKSHA